MIVTSETMKKCEEKSTFSSEELMEEVAFKLAIEIKKRHDISTSICIVCGQGNNGGDGFACARILLGEGYNVFVLPIETKQKTDESQKNRDLLNKKNVITFNKAQEKSFDIIIDAVYGFGFKGSLQDKIRPIMKWINESKGLVYSIDINSGAEADSGRYDRDTIKSTITFALGYLKPIHCLRKDHFLFQQVVCIPLRIPEPKKSDCIEMDEDKFIEGLPKLREDGYKGQTGKALLIGGCVGMVGALALNILGAKASGSTYLHVACDEAIYPILASREITPIFHPFTKDTVSAVLRPLIPEVNAIGFGSGASYLEVKRKIQELILQQSVTPVVLDAEAIRLLIGNLYILKLIQTPVVLTPHLKEFADLVGLPIEVINADKIKIAQEFAKEYHVILVLKGPCTLVVSPFGEYYVNQTGNASLARAGSGDLLTGLITGFISQKKDIIISVVMAVWLHGKAADLAIQKHPMTTMQPEYLIEAIEDFYFSKKR